MSFHFGALIQTVFKTKISGMIVQFQHLTEYGNITIHKLHTLCKVETMQQTSQRKLHGLYRIAMMIMDGWNMHANYKNIFRLYNEKLLKNPIFMLKKKKFDNFQCLNIMCVGRYLW